MRISSSFRVALVSALAATAVATNATVLLNVNFDSYTTGTALTAISPWFTTGDRIKVNAFGNTGKSASAVWATAGAWAWQDTPVNPIGAEKVVVCSSDIYYQSGSTALNGFIIGMEAYTAAVGFVGGVYVDSVSGDVVVEGTQLYGQTAMTGLAPNTWHSIKSVIDFNGKCARAMVNGVFVGPAFSIDQVDMNDFDILQSKQTDVNPTALGFTDNWKIETVTPASFGMKNLTGKVTLSNFTLPPDVFFYSIALANPGTSTVVDRATVIVNATGDWTFSTIAPAGSYDVYIKGGTFLSKKAGTFNVTSGATNVDAVLANGDATGDDIVDLSDYTSVVVAFNAGPADTNWDQNADLNGDNIVDLTDYTIVVSAFNAVGDAQAAGISM
ncbi:MAG: hypothetical protein K8R88_11185 [Armatimonadetes bacterium]|nr:hypothetical protein [Armatimonadota bacterium]